MAKGPPDKPKNKKISEAKRQNANVLIASACEAITIALSMKALHSIC